MHARSTAGSSLESMTSYPSSSWSCDCRFLIRYGVSARSVDRPVDVPNVLSMFGLMPLEKNIRTGVSSLDALSGVMGGGGGCGGAFILARSVKTDW